jgi:hypothetical protein
MCSNNSDISQCLNGGQCNLGNTCISESACFVGNFCEIHYNAAHLPLTGAIVQGLSSARDIYIVHYNKLLGCYDIPFVSVIMTDGGILFIVAIAIERVLLECFDFNINGSRIRAMIVYIIIIFFACSSNIDEIFIRRLDHDSLGDDICIYDFDGQPIWRRFDIVLSYTHVIIPCTVHLICTICALATTARRKIFIRGTEHRFCRVWLQQLYLHRDFLIPPFCLIVCILPHGILGHLLQTCILYSDKSKLRLHISSVLLLFVPQMLSFISYVCPNEIYWQEFQQTILHRKNCCYFYHKQRKSRQKKQIRSQMKRRTSFVWTVDQDRTFNGLNDTTS